MATVSAPSHAMERETPVSSALLASADAPEGAESTDEKAIFTGPSRWHVLLATWLGGVFDGMDSSIFAMVLYPTLSELLHTTSHASVGQHGSYIIALFMLGWAIGAMFFGSLADHIGRAKTLTITILLYAVCTGLCAFAHNWQELGLYRFLVGAGIGGEMGIGAVLLNECWPGKTRVYAVGAMATSLGFGYFLTALLNLWLGGFGWRWLFIAGVAPAFLTFYLRAKLKEPEEFMQHLEERAKAAARQDSPQGSAFAVALGHSAACFKGLFDQENLRKTIAVAAVASTAIVTWWAVIAWIPAWINQLTGQLAVAERSHAMFLKDIGMILSGVLGGLLIRRFGYKTCMGTAFTVACFSAIGMFMTVKSFGPALLCWLVVLGFFAHLPFVIMWTYIPELYAVRIRSTAFGFIYNFGRFLAAFVALGSGALIQFFHGSYSFAASTVAGIYLVGLLAVAIMPAQGDHLESVTD